MSKPPNFTLPNWSRNKSIWNEPIWQTFFWTRRRSMRSLRRATCCGLEHQSSPWPDSQWRHALVLPYYMQLALKNSFALSTCLQYRWLSLLMFVFSWLFCVCLWFHSLQTYEEKAVELGSGLDRLWTIRKQLEDSRDTCPLFDTQRTVKSLEKAMDAMWHKYEWGSPVEHIEVTEWSHPTCKNFN